MQSQLSTWNPPSPKLEGHPTGVYSWFTYTPGFSSSFAKSAIREFVGEERRDELVADIWNGAGTTTAAAHHLGVSAVGLELNPALVIVARAKSVTRRQLLNGSRRALDIASRRLRRKSIPRSLRDWLGIDAGAPLPRMHCPSHALSALLLLNTSRACYQETRPGFRCPGDRVRAELQRQIDLVESSAELLPARRSADCRVLTGDARKAGQIRDNTISLLLSSPPYCTRIDYGRLTGFEQDFLGVSERRNARALREQLMGTTALRTEGNWRAEGAKLRTPAVRRVLEKVRRHSSHRSEAYYYRNFLQYFCDAELASATIARVLRPRGRALLVLQDSFYKEVHIPLSKLYIAMAESVGLKGSIVHSVPVLRTMAARNPGTRKYRQGAVYSEDVVLLERS